MKLDRTYTEATVRKLVLQAAQPFAEKRQGSTGVTAWALRHNVAKGHLSAFMSGECGPCTDVLNALGLQWAIVSVQRAKADASLLPASIDVVGRDTIARALYDAWPHTVVSSALAEKTGLPVGAVLTWEVAVAHGADMSGLYRYADAIVPLVGKAREATDGQHVDDGGKLRAPPPEEPMSEAERQAAIERAKGQLRAAFNTDTRLATAREALERIRDGAYPENEPALCRTQIRHIARTALASLTGEGL